MRCKYNINLLNNFSDSNVLLRIYSGMGTSGMLGGVMQKMTYISMSIGLLGQGVQMLGMNAEMIQNAITGLMQMLAQSTHSLNELVGCDSDQSSGPMAALKVDPHTGSLVPKSTAELMEETKAAAQRRRTARWIMGISVAALCWWRLHLREQRSRRSRTIVDEFASSGQQMNMRNAANGGR